MVGCGREGIRAAVGTPAGSKSLYFEDLLKGAVTMLDELGDSSLLWT